MSNIHIKNATFVFSGGVGDYPLNLPFQPNQAIVRSISYAGPNDRESGVYMIRTSISQDFIGHFQVSNYSVTVNPQTHILIKSPMQQSINFSVHTPAGQGEWVSVDLTGDLVISIDFIAD